LSTFLIDTHAVLWFLIDDPRLSAPAKTAMQSPDHVLLVSAACTWEIAIKKRLGKLQAPDDLPAVLRAQGFDNLTITTEHAWLVTELPSGDHKDPFDRLLVAQALSEGLPIISGDQQLDRYGIHRLW
jgi:PIN domain nuclease of toxin-antitoxin system